VSFAGDIVFGLLALLAIGSALMTVLSTSTIRAAIGLLGNIIALAGLYLVLHAHLLAALQLIVYAGAVVVLFIFVIMLIGPTPVTPTGTRSLVTRVLGGATMAMLTTALINAVSDVPNSSVAIAECPPGAIGDCMQFGGVRAFGSVLYGPAALPFELISILLLVAVLGALAVGRGRSQAEIDGIRRRKQLDKDAHNNSASAAAEAVAE
jgi:NADH-quinone oxidoreductase subunit J